MTATKFPSTHMNPMFRQVVTLLPWATELCFNIVQSKDERVAGRRPATSPEQKFRSYLQAHGCDVPRLEAAVYSLLEDGASATALKEVVSTVADAAAGKQDLAQLVHRLAHCCGVPVPDSTPRPAPAQMSALSPADAPAGTTWTPGMDPESAWLFSQTLPAPAGAPTPSGYARRGDRFWPLRVRPMPETPTTPVAQSPASVGPPVAAQPSPASPDPVIGASSCTDPTPPPSPGDQVPSRRPRTRRFLRRIVVRQPQADTPDTMRTPGSELSDPPAVEAAPAATATTAEAQPVPAGAPEPEGHQLAAIEKLLGQIESRLCRQLVGLEQKLTAKLAEGQAKQQEDLAALTERVASLESQAAAKPVLSPIPPNDAPSPTPPTSQGPAMPEPETTANAPSIEVVSPGPLASEPSDPAGGEVGATPVPETIAVDAVAEPPAVDATACPANTPAPVGSSTGETATGEAITSEGHSEGDPR